jgi:GDP-D-glucose phosphorylase
LQNSTRDLIVINVSPLEFGASLLLPSVDSCLPQVLTVDSIRLAIRTVLLSGVKNFKAAFNSLCAFASVNHMHWHLYYLQKHELKLETIAAKRVSPASDCYEVSERDYPAPCYAFQITVWDKTQ